MFDDAIIAWQTGHFEGTAVFRTEDPDEEELTEPAPARCDAADTQVGLSENEAKPELPADAVTPDANTAGIRIDLSGMGGRP